MQNPTPGCGECRACQRGRPSVCLRREPPDLLDFTRGAFCRYKVVPAARLLRVPDALSTRAAALTEPTAIAIHTVNLSGATPDDRVLVTGGGPVGLLTTAVLRARGIDDITVSEPAPLRRERALRGRRGARDRAGRDLPRAPMGRPVAEPYTLAFECSGNAAAAESAFDQLDYAGTLVFVGTGHDMPRINHNRVIVLELTIIGAYNYDVEGFAPALELLASGDAAARRCSSSPTTCCSTTCSADDAPPRGGRAARQGDGPTRGPHVSEPASRRRLNHVAITHGSRACSTTRGRAELLDFYGDVFGWTEGDNTGEAGNPLILYTGAFGQFVYLLPGDPLLCARRRWTTSACRSRRSTSSQAIVDRAKAPPGERRARHAHRRARPHDPRPDRTTTRSRARTSAS